MENVKEEIIASLKKVIKNLTGQEMIIKLEHPVGEEHGDYSTNIALVISKLKSQNSKPNLKTQILKTPLELAQAIVKILNTKYLIHHTDRIEAVAPGFINFWLSKDYLINSLSEPQFPEKTLSGKNIMVEFTDPNPFKEFHVGHLYTNTVGEAISRILEANGAIVKRANYQGDVGMHIAKSLYAILQISNLKSQISNLGNKSEKEKAEFLGKAYALGARAYESDEKAKKEIEELNKKIYAKDKAIMPLYEKGRQWSLEYFETIYKRLGTKFDYYYFESEVGIEGLELVKEYLKKGVFEKSQGAVIFPGEKYKLHNRVFVNSLGLPTYEAKELGLALKKYRDFNYDQSIVITGNEIIGYFKVLLAALGKIKPDLAAKTKHLSHGMVRLPTGKMSSRSGNVLTGEWLLDEAKRRIKANFKEMNEGTAEKVAVGAVKYALLKSGIGRDIVFDFDESISLEGNSGPYLQYTFARTCSVLAKLKSQISKLKTKSQNSKLENEEISLLRALSRFEEVVEEAGGKFAPNLLCNYLFDLAQKFNLFYQKHKILESKNEEFRLVLTKAVGQIVKNGLSLLGINAPERM